MNPASGNPAQIIEGATASSGLLAANLRLWLLSVAVVLVVFLHRQMLRIMVLARGFNC